MIMTGGSGMHIRAITHGLDNFPNVPEHIRNKVALLFQESGIQYLQEIVKTKDPQYAKIVDMNNPHRLIRAISVMEVSQRPYSSYLRHSPKKTSTPTFLALTAESTGLILVLT